MAHSQVWNASYEAIPANGDDASEGALRIRNLKRDIKERLALDHVMDETDDDGLHKQITFHEPLGSDPTNAANKGFLYTKDVSAKVELFFMDEDGDVVQLTSEGRAGAYPHAQNDEFLLRPDATAGVAPGWSTEAITNKAVRINSSAVHSTADGGTASFTATLNSNKASGNPSVDLAHDHDNGTLSVTIPGGASVSGSPSISFAPQGTVIQVAGRTAASTDLNHTHTHNHDVQYADFRIVSKD